MTREREVRWPDGWSASIPLPFVGGRIGGTYYSSPGSPGAPRLTLTRSWGMPGAGLNAVFLREGMTSNDTLGPGFSGNVSTFLPSVSLNGTMPNNDIFRPWKTRVTSVEAGIGTPNASPAFTTTYTPQQIADFLTKYLFSPASGPEGKSAFVRDSAAAAGTPSRNNVFEYGFPDPGTASQATGPVSGQKRGAAIFETGASPIPFAVAPQNAPRGLPGLLFEDALIDPSGSGDAPAGGVAGLVQDYLRKSSPLQR